MPQNQNELTDFLIHIVCILSGLLLIVGTYAALKMWDISREARLKVNAAPLRAPKLENRLSPEVELPRLESVSDGFEALVHRYNAGTEPKQWDIEFKN